MNEPNATLPQSPPERPAVWPKFLIAIYALAAVAMFVLAVRPSLALEGAPDGNVRWMRVLFVFAGLVNVVICVAGLRRRAWVRSLAVVLHACVAAVALLGLVSMAAGHPQFGTDVGELVAKCLVHVAAALLWRTQSMRRFLASGAGSQPSLSNVADDARV